MDDLSSMLSGILNSPDGMEKIKNMAQNLFGDTNQAFSPAPEQTSVPNNQSSGFGEISPNEIAGMMKVVTALKSGANDSNAQLLMSLRPHLSPQRQKRVDEAVKILRLVSMLPVIKNAGIL